VVRTWAPQGQTPIHRHRPGRRDKIFVISGISVSPRRRRLGLYYLLFYDNIGQDEVCVLLRELLRRLRIEYFPSYAPQLNPDEGVWALAKQQLANSCPNDVDELMEDILGSIDGIRNSQEKLRGCIVHSELPFSLR